VRGQLELLAHVTIGGERTLGSSKDGDKKQAWACQGKRVHRRNLLENTSHWLISYGEGRKQTAGPVNTLKMWEGRGLGKKLKRKSRVRGGRDRIEKTWPPVPCPKKESKKRIK